MKRSRFAEEQIIGILKEHRAGLPAAELFRQSELSGLILYARYDVAR